jgi:hypothetical protein
MEANDGREEDDGPERVVFLWDELNSKVLNEGGIRAKRLGDPQKPRETLKEGRGQQSDM